MPGAQENMSKKIYSCEHVKLSFADRLFCTSPLAATCPLCCGLSRVEELTGEWLHMSSIWSRLARVSGILVR